MLSFTKNTNPKDIAATSRVPLWLLSPIAKAKWALAQFAGLIKYGAWNWRKSGVRASVYIAAAERHLDAWKSGESVDPIDGTDHRANVMACMGILIDAEAAGKLIDDRPPALDLRPTYAECEALAAKLREQYADKTPEHLTIASDLEDEAPTEPPPAIVGARAKHGSLVRVKNPASCFAGKAGTVFRAYGAGHHFEVALESEPSRTYAFGADELEVLA